MNSSQEFDIFRKHFYYTYADDQYSLFDFFY